MGSDHKDDGPEHLPYGRQSIDKQDIQAVVEVLESDWLTTGPKVAAFEEALCEFTGADHAVAVANGTAALHGAMFAAGLGPGDEAIVPAMTFAATANAVVFQGAKPVFCDVERETLLIDPEDAAERITSKTKAIIAVDYAGQPADYRALRELADDHDLTLIADAAHSIGASEGGIPVGQLADFSTFSFHPVKTMTTGEGGAITTHDTALAEKMRRFRNHGLNSDHRERAEKGSWYYEMQGLGYNYRLSDLQCALGMSQLKKLPGFLERRRELARAYDERLLEVEGVEPLAVREGVEHAYHLYVVRVTENHPVGRDDLFEAMRDANIGVNVHYIPVHLHPYYREKHGTETGLCPTTEAAYEQILSIPMFPEMTRQDVDRVVEAIAS